MSQKWILVLVALLLVTTNCATGVVIQTDLDGEVIREPEELIILSEINPS